jgi:hypothetical protein
MAETLNFGQAVQRAGISRQRLNEAIRSGRLPATRGGGPSKPTTIQLEDLQAWCMHEGLAIPLEAGGRLERLSSSTGIAEMMARLDQMFPGMERLERLVGDVLERLERSQPHAIGPSAPAIDCPPLPRDRAGIIAHIRHARDVEHKQFQDIAEELNTAGIPTFSGRGKWGKGNIARFYRER